MGSFHISFHAQVALSKRTYKNFKSKKIKLFTWFNLKRYPSLTFAPTLGFHKYFKRMFDISKACLS